MEGPASCRAFHVSGIGTIAVPFGIPAGPQAVSVPWNPSMDRETTLLLALGMLIASALAVGVSGVVLFTRDRRLVRAAHGTTDRGSHPEGHEES
jgi:hypothetical protein